MAAQDGGSDAFNVRRMMELMGVSARACLREIVDAAKNEDGEIVAETVTVPTHYLALVLIALDRAENADEGSR